MPEPAAETAPAAEEPAADADTAADDPAVNATLPPDSDKKETGDADPYPQYTLEEIWRFIKKRMAEDAEAEQTEKEKAEIVEKQEPVTDHAPRIPVTVMGSAAGNGLTDLFNTIKGVK